MAELILAGVAILWIAVRVAYPARWHEVGIFVAIALAIVPTLMGMRQDPTVQAVVLPIASGLVLGDVLHRVVFWLKEKIKTWHQQPSQPPAPPAAERSKSRSTSSKRSKSGSKPSK